MGNTVGLVPTNGWINGLLSCFNWNIIGKGKAPQIEQSEFFILKCGKNLCLESGLGQHFSWHIHNQ